MVRVPPALTPGDTIALACPAGYMSKEKVETCVRTLEAWGYRVVVGKRVGSSSSNYFSGTDKERGKEFQQFLDDPKVQAILCARGGYGMSRIIDQLHFRKFRKQPKWVIGFSDITVLHSHLYAKYSIASLHAPMAAAFNDGGASGEYVGSLKKALAGERLTYSCPPHALNRRGSAKGELVGGNLTLLAHLCGTDSAPKTKGRILFLEDVGEQFYNIDRMLVQLKRNGKLAHLAGLIVGGFTQCKDTERPYGETAYEIIRHAVSEYRYPVCFGFPVSHEVENVALKVGVKVQLKVSRANVSLSE